MYCHPRISFLILVKYLMHSFASHFNPINLCSSVSAIPIRRTEELLQENQALLHSVPPTDKNTGLFVNTKPFSEKTDTRKVHQNNAVPNTTQNRRGGSSRGRRGSRGGHQDTPQSRRPTLLEMVKPPPPHFRNEKFALYNV